MDRRFLTVLGVSLLFALLVAGVFYQISGRARAAPAKQKTEMKDVVIAASALAVGSNIKPTDVRVVKIAADHFPQGAFQQIDEIVGRPVISTILAEEAVLEARLAERGSGFGLSPIIPVGMRAVSVRVNDVVGVAGFVLPGMRVDVLATVRPPGSSAARTTTVLQNIIVLSAGQQIQPDRRGEAVNVPVVTLLVTPEQAELLTLASSEGKIQLVLRNGRDQTVETTPGRNMTELYGGRTPEPRPAPVRRSQPEPQLVLAPPLPPVEEVVVIRGTKKTVEVVGEARTN